MIEYKVGDWVLLKGRNTGNGLLVDEAIVKLLEVDERLTGNVDPDFSFEYEGKVEFNTRKEYIIRKLKPYEIPDGEYLEDTSIVKEDDFTDLVKLLTNLNST